LTKSTLALNVNIFNAGQLTEIGIIYYILTDIIPPIDDNRKQKFIKYESIESNEKLKKMQQLKTEFEDHLYDIYYRDIT